MGEIVKPLDPNDFKVVKIYSFTDPFSKKRASVGYQRPLSSIYDSKKNDEFDERFESWLKEHKFEDVEMIVAQNILFEGQIDYLHRRFVRLPQSKLSIIAHGNYTMDEMIENGQIEGCKLEFPIYWNVCDDYRLSDEGGIMVFDKDKEKYFFEVLESLKAF